MVLLRHSRAEQRVRQLVKSGLRISIVVPCYNVQGHVADVVATIPDYVQHVILVNDCSKDDTGSIVDQLSDERVVGIHLSGNSGVGGAVLTGFGKAIALGADVIVKMDGDGQMDPYYLPLLIEPLLIGKADYTKGNRFTNILSLSEMPLTRRAGNAGLSFLTKLASGYWNVFDPNNGYIAIRAEIVEMLPDSIIDRRYFFESSLLIALGILGAVALDIPMPARYRDEQSNLRVRRVLFEFPFRLIGGFMRRVWFRKVLYSITIEAILGTLGIILILSGTVFGVIEFIHYAVTLGVTASAGTVMTAALPIFLGFQMVLNAILQDVQSVPSVPICEGLSERYPVEAIAINQGLSSSGGGTR